MIQGSNQVLSEAAKEGWLVCIAWLCIMLPLTAALYWLACWRKRRVWRVRTK